MASTTFVDFSAPAISAPWLNDVNKHVYASVLVTQYGADPTGVADSTAAIIAAQQAVFDAGGGELIYPPGTYLTSSPITQLGGVTHKGQTNKSVATPSQQASIITNSTSAVFKNTDVTLLTNSNFEGLTIIANAGHIFDWTSSGIVAKCEISRCTLLQRSTSHSVVYATAALGIFSIWMHDFEFEYAPQNTVPAIYFASTTVNSCVIDTFWSTCNGEVASTGTYAIWIESTNPGGTAFNCAVRNGVFELPVGGSVNMLSCEESLIELCGVYDLSVLTNNPQFNIAKGSLGPASRNVTLDNCRSVVGTITIPDVRIDFSVASQALFKIMGSNFTWVDGVSVGNGPGLLITDSAISNIKNCAYTSIGAKATEDFAFKSTSGTSADVTFWNGYPGNFDGQLNIKVNGTNAGVIHKDGYFSWGGSTILGNGKLQGISHAYPGTPAGAQQTATGLLGGTGVPSNAEGNNGDFYLRSDGGVGSCFYQKRTGAWVAVA